MKKRIKAMVFDSLQMKKAKGAEAEAEIDAEIESIKARVKEMEKQAAIETLANTVGKSMKPTAGEFPAIGPATGDVPMVNEAQTKIMGHPLRSCACCGQPGRGITAAVLQMQGLLLLLQEVPVLGLEGR